MAPGWAAKDGSNLLIGQRAHRLSGFDGGNSPRNAPKSADFLRSRQM